MCSTFRNALAYTKNCTLFVDDHPTSLCRFSPPCHNFFDDDVRLNSSNGLILHTPPPQALFNFYKLTETIRFFGYRWFFGTNISDIVSYPFLIALKSIDRHVPKTKKLTLNFINNTILKKKKNHSYRVFISPAMHSCL